MLLAQIMGRELFQNPNRSRGGCEDMEFPGLGIKERQCGNFRSQLIEREVEYTICRIC